jgi:hypothetical protein
MPGHVHDGGKRSAVRRVEVKPDIVGVLEVGQAAGPGVVVDAAQVD